VSDHGPQSFEERARRVVADHVPDADLEAMEVMFNLLRAAARVVHDFETNVHRPFGQTWAASRVLFYVWVAGPISPREIADLANVSRASISSVLNTLEERGLVVRTRVSPDRRVVLVELTERGRSHVATHWREQHERERSWAAALDEGQRHALVDALRTLAAHPLPPPARHTPGDVAPASRDA
jgi:MarR family transcriptional regulator, organic hydroperoxide resistance regulator